MLQMLRPLLYESHVSISHLTVGAKTSLICEWRWQSKQFFPSCW